MQRISQICLLVIAICLFSCKTDEEFTSGLMEDNLKSLIQTFSLDLETGETRVGFETDAGCEFSFSPVGFSYNGSAVTGVIKVEVIEIFDKGTMAITGKHTMSEDSILVSGGEFFVRAYQGDNELDFEYIYNIEVPSSLSGDYSTNMQLFTGGEGLNSTQDWVSAINVSDVWGIFNQDSTSSYSIQLSGFQWFNCDRYLNDTRPKIDLDLKVPSQFTRQNSSIYLAIKEEKSSLGSARSGKYPVGLDIHLIFVAEVENQFLYQIISGAVSDEEYEFKRGDMQSVSADGLRDLINGLE